MGHSVNLRKLVVNGDVFLWRVQDGDCDDSVYFRCYGPHKSSYLEVRFNASQAYNGKLNLHRPASAELLVRYGIGQGWNYREPNQQMLVQEAQSMTLAATLGLDKLGEAKQ